MLDFDFSKVVCDCNRFLLKEELKPGRLVWAADDFVTLTEVVQQDLDKFVLESVSFEIGDTVPFRVVNSKGNIKAVSFCPYIYLSDEYVEPVNITLKAIRNLWDKLNPVFRCYNGSCFEYNRILTIDSSEPCPISVLGDSYTLGEFLDQFSIQYEDEWISIPEYIKHWEAIEEDLS